MLRAVCVALFPACAPAPVPLATTTTTSITTTEAPATTILPDARLHATPELFGTVTDTPVKVNLSLMYFCHGTPHVSSGHLGGSSGSDRTGLCPTFLVAEPFGAQHLSQT